MLRTAQRLIVQHIKQGKVSGVKPASIAPLSTSTSSLKELSAFHLKKITNEFDHMYDMNNDGFVDKSDIVLFKRRLKQYMEQFMGQALKDTYTVGYDDYWTLLHELADTNRDGRIAREEWIQMWTHIVEKSKGHDFNSLPQWVQLMPGSIFPVMDRKGDGVLDEEEYRQFWHIVGEYPLIDEVQLAECFNVMTEDGKHKMDLNRVQELYADFYLSDDPSTPGKYIGGPINFLLP